MKKEILVVGVVFALAGGIAAQTIKMVKQHKSE